MSFLLCSQDFHQFSDRMKNQPPGDGSGIVKPKGIFNEERVLFFFFSRKLPQVLKMETGLIFPEEPQQRSS